MMRVPAIVVLLAALLAGCSATPAPPDAWYRVILPAPQGTSLDVALKLAPVTADGVVNGRAMLYSRPDAPEQLAQHAYAFWAEAPPRLVEDALMADLRARGAQLHGLRAPQSVAWELSLRVLRFEQRLSAAQPAALVELEVELRRGRNSLWSQRFSAQAAAGGSSPGDAAVAMSAALSDIFARCAQQIESSIDASN